MKDRILIVEDEVAIQSILYGIGFVVVSLAVLVASYTVIRLKPRDILTKMD